jgi:hypothetical protein
MGIKRSVFGLVTMAVALGTVAISPSTAAPRVYYELPSTKVARQIVTVDSATTSTASPDVYYE